MFRGPPVHLICPRDLTFAYVPGHLSHICFELLKNSLRAVVERYGPDNEDNFPPIRVVVVEGKEDITIKISDEGGGIPRSAIPLIWTYMYTTMETQPIDQDFQASDFKAPMAGFGYGLPLSRLVRVFGPAVSQLLVSCPSFSTRDTLAETFVSSPWTASARMYTYTSIDSPAAANLSRDVIELINYPLKSSQPYIHPLIRTYIHLPSIINQYYVNRHLLDVVSKHTLGLLHFIWLARPAADLHVHHAVVFLPSTRRCRIPYHSVPRPSSVHQTNVLKPSSHGWRRQNVCVCGQRLPCSSWLRKLGGWPYPSSIQDVGRVTRHGKFCR